MYVSSFVCLVNLFTGLRKQSLTRSIRFTYFYAHRLLPCLVPRHQYCARPMRFGSRDPSECLSHSSLTLTLTVKQHSLKKKRSTPIPAPTPTPPFTDSLPLSDTSLKRCIPFNCWAVLNAPSFEYEYITKPERFLFFTTPEKMCLIAPY